MTKNKQLPNTCAQLIVRILEQNGINTVYGIPGSHNVELFDALRASSLKTYLATSELTAAFMAEAYGKVTGKPAALVLIPGPGITYAATGIAGAKLDSTPMLVVVAGCRNDIKDKKFYIHELKTEKFTSEIAKSFFRIEAPDEINEVLAQAILDVLNAEPGPVVVEIPTNVFRQTAKSVSKQNKKYSFTLPDNDDLIKTAAHLISDSKHPCIYTGQGAFNASLLITALAEKIGAPVATTISGRGVIPEDHPLCAGYGFGPTGKDEVKKLFDKCDTLISVGCKYAEMSSGGWYLKIPENHIRIDTAQEVLDTNYPGTLNIIMDASMALKKLIAIVGPPDENNLQNRQNLIIKTLKSKSNADKTHIETGKLVSPEFFFRTLRNVLPRDSILCCDCGMHQFFAISHFQIYEPRTFITSVDFQSMGFGIPAVLATQLAFPKRKVIGIAGDGGLLMTGMELINIVREKISPIIFVFRDNNLGLIEGLQKHIYKSTFAVKLHNPDYAKLAESFQFSYVLINTNDHLENQLTQILKSETPTLVEVSIHYNDLPHFVKEKMKATAKSLPIDEKIMVGGRMLKRKLFPP